VPGKVALMWLENPYVLIALTVVVLILVRFLLALILSGGDLGRVGLAMRSGLRTLRNPEFAGKVRNLLYPPPPPPPPKPSGAPLRFLVLLQREGRLVDFLLEDIQAYDNEQIGAAVRDIHAKCRKALNEHLLLEPVRAENEGDSIEVPPGFDPSAVRLTGNV